MLIMKPKALKDPLFLDTLFQKYPAMYQQQKINGIRAYWDPDSQVLRSSGGLPITSVPHIVQAIKDSRHSHYPFDGELYVHGWSLNRISGAARSHIPTADSLLLDYQVFDLMQPWAYTDRSSMLYYCNIKRPVRVVQSTILVTPQQALETYNAHLHNGYEGIILRVPNATYRSGRHVGNIYKMKPEHSMEGILVGFKPATTDLHADTFGSLIILLPNKEQVTCGGLTEEERQELWAEKPLGCIITIKYDEMGPNGIPLRLRYGGMRWEGDIT